MRGEHVFYLEREESLSLLEELDALVRTIYPDIKQSLEEIQEKHPNVLAFMGQLNVLLGASIDRNQTEDSIVPRRVPL